MYVTYWMNVHLFIISAIQSAWTELISSIFSFPFYIVKVLLALRDSAANADLLWQFMPTCIAAAIFYGLSRIVFTCDYLFFRHKQKNNRMVKDKSLKSVGVFISLWYSHCSYFLCDSILRPWKILLAKFVV